MDMVEVYKGLEALGFESEVRVMPKAPPGYVRKYSRAWRFDWAHIPSKTAVEFEGGIWVHGRHTRGSGFGPDSVKYNWAAANGWTVLRYTYENVDKKPWTFWMQVIYSAYG